MIVYIQKLRDDANVPVFGSAQAAGADLSACLDADYILGPGQRKLIPCGFAMELPRGYEAQIRPRSGLALKHGITVLNSPGTIDSDYRGEVGVLLINHTDMPHLVRHGDRIAQMVIARHEQPTFQIDTMLTETTRGDDGFGSTGA